MLLSDEQRMVRDAARTFAREQLAPHSAEWDRTAAFPRDALRAYEGARYHRIARTQQEAHRQARIYGLTGTAAFVRNLGMRALGGERLRARYDWLYNWRPPEFVSA